MHDSNTSKLGICWRPSTSAHEDPVAAELAPDPGLYRISLSEFSSTDVKVTLQVSGSATNNDDYFLENKVGDLGFVIIQAGSMSRLIRLDPTNDP